MLKHVDEGKGGSKWAEAVGRSQATRIFVGCATEFRFYYKQCEVREAFQAGKGQVQPTF